MHLTFSGLNSDIQIMTRTVRLSAVAVFVAFWLGTAAWLMHLIVRFDFGIWASTSLVSVLLCIGLGAAVLKVLAHVAPNDADGTFEDLFPTPLTVGFGAGNCTEADLFGDADLLGEDVPADAESATAEELALV